MTRTAHVHGDISSVTYKAFFPSVTNIDFLYCPNLDVSKYDEFSINGFVRIYRLSNLHIQNDQAIIEEDLKIFVNYDKKILVEVNKSREKICIIGENLDQREWSDLIKPYLLDRKPVIKSPSIYFLGVQANGSLCLRKSSIPKQAAELDYPVELLYGDRFVDKHNEILSKFEKANNGIIVLFGPPGTGKTSYIYRISRDIDSKFIYVPTGYTEQISSPGFMSLMTDQTGSTIILEDAKFLLEKSKGYNDALVSAVLNLSDGMVGKALQLKFIITANTSINDINPAIVRRGRLLSCVEFPKLDPKGATRLYKKIYNEEKLFEEDISLAEIFNVNPNHVEEILAEEKRKIGF